MQQRGIAIVERNRAEERARVALSRQLASEALALGPSAADLALLLAVEAMRVEDTPQARSSVFRLLASNQTLGGLLGAAVRGAASLAFSPDAKLLAVGIPGAVTVWDVRTRREVQRFAAEGKAPLSVAFSSSGLIAAGMEDGRLIVWSRDSAKMVVNETVGENVLAIAFDQDGSRVAAGDVGGNVVVVSMDGARTLHLRGDQGPTNTVWLEGDTLVAGGGQGDITQWDLTKPDASEHRYVGAGQPLEAAFDRRLTQFAGYTGGSQTPYIDDAKTGDLRHGPLGGAALNVDELAFSADGSLLAAAGARGGIVIWDTASGEREPFDLRGHPGTVEDLAFAPDGGVLAAGGAGGVSIFDLRGSPLVSAISPRGVVPISEVPNVVRAGASAAFNNDGSMLAWPVGATERQIVVWDLVANSERMRLDGDGVFAFGDDGATLALETFFAEAAAVVDLKTKQSRKQPADSWRSRRKGAMELPKDRLWAVDNGQGLGASVSFDGTLTLWDTRRSVPVGSVGIPGAFDYSYLVFDNAGRRLAVMTSGGALAIVNVYAPSWIERACNLAARDLDAAEWRQYVGEDRVQTPVCAPATQ